jgi:hypothetical protein
MKIFKVVFLSIVLIFSFTFLSYAIDWKITNQVTIAWDAVATLSDGSALPANHSVKYKVFLANAITDPDKANPALVTDPPIDQLQHTITLNTEGRFIVGVSTIRYDENGNTVSESAVNWSDTNGENTPNPFGLMFYFPPAEAKNLR